MDCVWIAYTNYLDYLGEKLHPDEIGRYKWLKSITHDNISDFISGGVAGHLIEQCAQQYHPISSFVRVIHPEFDKEYWLELYKDSHHVRWLMAQNTEFFDWHAMIEPCAKYPAIYLLLQLQHAEFLEHVPETGMPILAIRLSKEI